MGFLNFGSKNKPQKPSPVEVVNLDMLVTKDVYFKFKDKLHCISPLSTLEFVEFTKSLSDIFKRTQQDANLGETEVISLYGSLFMSVCKTLTQKDIAEMSVQQISALTSLVIETVSGKKVDPELEKKN